MGLPPLFNPSNDMALAANLRQYTPPRHIQQMEEDLATLSRFWAEGPWGWSLATKQRYLKKGIAESNLPSDESLAEVRRLSSREFALEYYRELYRNYSDHSRNGLVPCQMTFVGSVTEVVAFAEENEGKGIMLKAPWSSSGRGNIILHGKPDEATTKRIQRILREQGGLLMEPYYANKILDFALEFQAGDEGTHFLGYSVFDADEMGHYGGNYIASQEQMLDCMGLPNALLRGLIQYHCEHLSRLPYRGPVGIDMMKLADGRIHPCVEINFRMTMGRLALLLYHKGIRDDQLLTPYRPDGFTAEIRSGRLRLAAPRQQV